MSRGPTFAPIGSLDLFPTGSTDRNAFSVAPFLDFPDWVHSGNRESARLPSYVKIEDAASFRHPTVHHEYLYSHDVRCRRLWVIAGTPQKIGDSMEEDVKSDVKTLLPPTTIPHSVDRVLFTISKFLKPFCW